MFHFNRTSQWLSLGCAWLLIGWLSASLLSAQTTLLSESFETDGNGSRYSTSIPEFSDGGGDFFTRTDGGNIGSYTVSGADGSFFFAAQDIDGEGASATQTLTFSGINVAGYANLSFSGLFAEDDDGSNEDWDPTDLVFVEVSLDGGPFTKVLQFANDGSPFNSAPFEDTDFDGIGDGTELTSTFQSFSAAIIGTASTMDVRITCTLNSGDEDIAFDLLEVTGDLMGGSPMPQVFYTESFETDGNGSRYSTSTPEFSDGSEDFFTRTDGSNIAGGYVVTGFDGSFFFAAQDIDGEGASLPQTLTLSGISVSGISNLSFSALFAEDDDGSNQDWDNGDVVFVEASLDGGAFVKILQFANDGSPFNAEPGLDTDFDGVADGPALTDAFAEFTAAIPGTGSSLDLRITFNLNSGDEDIALDLITLSGEVGTPGCIDAAPPVAVCQPTFDLFLDETGSATLDAAELDNGSSDDCTVAALLAFSVDQSNFGCANVMAGPVAVTLTVTDQTGASSTCNSNITVLDTLAPVVVAQSITLNLDASQQASLTVAAIDAGSSDNCGQPGLSLDRTSFDCEDIKPDTAVDASSLFFSEYVEGSGFVKYVEIFNGTGADVDLSDYQVELYSNGNAAPNDVFTLSGSLANGAVLVIANPSASGYDGPVITDGVVNFNGDDAVGLRQISSNALVDVFGVIGEDPGSQWNVGGVETQNQTLRRMSSVTGGVIPTAGFPELDDQWMEFPINTLDGLGSHDLDGFYAGVPVTLTATDASGNVATATANVFVTDTADVCGCNIALDSVQQMNESCEGLEDGSIAVFAVGANTIEYSIDGGLTWQSSNVFANLPMGPYYVQARDADKPMTCVSDTTIVNIAPGLPRPTFSTLAQSGSCLGNFDGSIEITPNSGVAPYSYSIDGGAFAPGGVSFTFTNVAAGDHFIRIQDASGCPSEAVEVITTATLPPTFKVEGVVDATDASSQDGRLKITPRSGEAPFMYSIDDGATYLSGSAPKSFANLNPGCYEIRIQDANGCESTSRTFCVNDLTVCPSRNTINRKIKKNASRSNVELRNVCEGESFMQWYKLRYVGSGEQIRIDWSLDETTGKIGERGTYNGSVQAPDAITGSDGPFGNGAYTFDANAGILGLEDLAERSDNLIFGINPVLLVNGAECHADPFEYKAIVYPTPEVVLDNAAQPGQTLRINSGDDPNGTVSVHTPVSIAERKALLQYDLFIAANPAIAELATAVDIMSIGSDDQNNDYDGFTALADAGISSFTNLTGMPITVSIEITPRLIPADGKADPCAGMTQSIDLIVLPQAASGEAKGVVLDPAAQQNLASQYQAYPNPAHRYLTVVIPAQVEMAHTLELLDLRGRVVARETLNADQRQARLRVSDLSEGMYLLRIRNSSGLVTVKKVVKK